MPKFTPEQAQAISLRNTSIALSAGAGCGKTFVLTQKFISHLRPGPDSLDLSQIVAITFTDKAAREMRDRVREACAAELLAAPEDEALHWLEVSRGLDTARITTIHSFCSGLLRSNAIAARLDPAVEQIDDTVRSILRTRVAREVLTEQLLAESPHADRLILRYDFTPLVGHLAHLLLDWPNLETSGTVGLAASELAQRWLQIWEQTIVPTLTRQFLQEESLLETQRVVAAGGFEGPKIIEKAQQLKEAFATLDAGNTASVKSLRAATIVGNSKTISNADIELKQAVTPLRAAIDSHLKRLIDVNAADLQIAAEVTESLAYLVNLTIERYRQEKTRQAKIDFDDMLVLTRNLLRDHPAIRRKAAAGIRLLMVDEFQDTDPVQAEIIRHLCGDQLKTGKLFLVGDVKQSIYGFRRADPRVFAQIRQELPPAGRLPLTTNFRSQPEILKFVNRVFEPVLGTDYEPLVPFHPHQQSPTPSIEFLWSPDPPPGSPTDVSTGNHDQAPDASESDGADGNESDSGDLNASRRRSREAGWIAGRIAELLADETPRVRDHDSAGNPILRRPQPRDIVILFRELGNVALYEHALRERNIPHYLIGGRTYYAQQEVFDLANLCRFLSNVDDEIALVGILRSPFFSISDDGLHGIGTHSGSLRSGLFRCDDTPAGFQVAAEMALDETDATQARFAARVLRQLLAWKDELGVAELLEEAVFATGYDAALLMEFLGERKLANLKKLIRQARAFASSSTASLADFVVYLDGSIHAQTREEDATTLAESGNVVRLMTIHKSKGLEFPIVIVTDMNPAQRGSQLQARIHPQLGPLQPLRPRFNAEHQHLGLEIAKREQDQLEREESLRVLYVALTRAADHLILSASCKALDQLASPWLVAIGQTFHLMTGQPHGISIVHSGEPGTPSVSQAFPIVTAIHTPPGQKLSGTSSPRSLTPLELVDQIDSTAPTPLPVTAMPANIRSQLPSLVSVSQLEAMLPRTPTEGATNTRTGVAREPVDDVDSLLNPSDAEVFGTLIHAVLEQIDFHRPGDKFAVLKRLLAQPEYASMAPQAALAEKWLVQFAASPVMAELREAKTIFRELDFLLPWTAPAGSNSFAGQSTTIVGTFDCVYESPGGRWTILDYKTSRFDLGDSNAELLADYAMQLALYERAFEQWLGHPVGEVCLIFCRPRFRKVTNKGSGLFSSQTALDNALCAAFSDLESSTTTNAR